MHHYKNKPQGAKGIAIRSKFLYNKGVVGFKSAAGIAADFLCTFSAPQVFYIVENTQAQQHRAVEQNADGKDQLKIAPFRTGGGAKAHNAQVPQPVCDRDQEQALHPAAVLFFSAQHEP